MPRDGEACFQQDGSPFGDGGESIPTLMQGRGKRLSQLMMLGVWARK